MSCSLSLSECILPTLLQKGPQGAAPGAHRDRGLGAPSASATFGGSPQKRSPQKRSPQKRPASIPAAASSATPTEMPFVCSLASLRVRNTFFDDGDAPLRSRSLEPFFRERLVQSCPTSPFKDEEEEGGDGVEASETATATDMGSPVKDMSTLCRPGDYTGSTRCPGASDAGDYAGSTRCPGASDPDFHMDADVSPPQRPTPALLTGPSQYTMAPCLTRTTFAAPAYPCSPMAAAAGCGFLMYPMSHGLAYRPPMTMVTAAAAPPAAPTPRNGSSHKVLSLAEAIDGPLRPSASAPAHAPPTSTVAAGSRKATKAAPAAAAPPPVAPPNAPPSEPPQARPSTVSGSSGVGAEAHSPEPATARSPPSPPSGFAPGSDELPSVGSEGHAEGKCKPCAFFHTAGCTNGVACQFCHLCDAEEKKRRRKEKIQAKRLAIKLRAEAESEEAAGAGAEGAGEGAGEDGADAPATEFEPKAGAVEAERADVVAAEEAANGGVITAAEPGLNG